MHTGSRTADAALAAAAALVYGALIFTILIAQPHHGDIAAGIRDWLIASATVIAAAGAVWAAVIAAKAYSRQTADQRRAQASSVAAWIENEIKTTGAGNAYLTREFLRIRNASQQPIFNVVITVKDGLTHAGLATFGRPTLPPNWDDTPQDISRNVRTGHRDSALYLVMSFVDNAGIRWRRETNTGRLIEE